ncbi:polysaccharide deacetylase family protein [Granulosicoccaceae sp. 1_MG-2023]|nr:polysaccharide deacetylase family protein [Granulosicoccaceae sp. 1_MG-2023]
MSKPLCAVSIHDVMPQTLSRCEDLFDLCTQQAITPVTLLVVPGQHWTAADLVRLRAMLSSGAVLAGHGWQHQVDRAQLRGPLAHLHSLLMSGDVAEHLALDSDAIAALIRRCHGWFAAQGLPEPALYVPPAWAMGRISRTALAALPFSLYEYFGGVYAVDAKAFRASPVAGFEAAGWRVPVVGAWNALARRRAMLAGQWRISLHPDDLSLGLRHQLRQLLQTVERPVCYSDLLADDGCPLHLA